MFFNLYNQGFVRVAAAAPHVEPADPAANAKAILALFQSADANNAALLLLPELALSGYAIDDLLLQSALLNGVTAAIADLVVSSRTLMPVLFVGAPLLVDQRLYNCAIAIHRGKILAAIPKTYLPNYREFYEKRHFASGASARSDLIMLCGQTVPFGTDILLRATDINGLILHSEICEDVWVPVPPSSFAAMAGAMVCLNLSASNATVGKSDARHLLCRSQSARLLAAYLYAAAGLGESTTDLAWDGQTMVYENGTLLGESERFSETPPLIFADIDLERLTQERLRQGSFGDCADLTGGPDFRTVEFVLAPPRAAVLKLDRLVDRFPFVPDEDHRLAELCYEAYNIQAQGLRKRLEASGVKYMVIGISGGLDSTQALLVAARAADLLNIPRMNILGYTLPAMATGEASKSNAWALMRALGITATEIDMGPACQQMLRDIGHPAATGAGQYDITYENVQAGARTSLLFRLANLHHGLVLGTGDLSELALGWCTYGVGDQMSHYNVNGAVPKTLIQHLIRWVAAEGFFGDSVKPVLEKILASEISPELVPGGQRTEDFVGPYPLQDFNLHYATRYGFTPSRIAYLAHHAWGDASKGSWPPHTPARDQVAYDLPTIKKWLKVFVTRFYQGSQFKRSAMPNGPKVSSGGSLSPRGDWRAPADASARLWLDDLNHIPD